MKNLTPREFVLWLEGFLAGLPSCDDIEWVVSTIQEKMTLIKEPELISLKAEPIKWNLPTAQDIAYELSKMFDKQAEAQRCGPTPKSTKDILAALRAESQSPKVDGVL